MCLYINKPSLSDVLKTPVINCYKYLSLTLTKQLKVLTYILWLKWCSPSPFSNNRNVSICQIL